MAYATPKTNWKAGDVPGATDFNRIEDNTVYLKSWRDTHEDEITALQAAMVTAQADIDTAESDIDDLETDLAALDSTVTTHTGTASIHQTAAQVREASGTALMVECRTSDPSASIGRIWLRTDL